MVGEADGQCTWSPLRIGVNPMNGSDAFENPDGDGYDVNKNGVLEPSEMFVNYLEYHVSTDLFLDNQTLSGMELPSGFHTDLFDNISDFGLPESTFAERASGAILAAQISLEKGSCDPFKADSDADGMPDGWEIWFARWNILDDDWTLNPLQPSDRWLDADDDGMTNWEEYNLIDSSLSENKRKPLISAVVCNHPRFSICIPTMAFCFYDSILRCFHQRRTIQSHWTNR